MANPILESCMKKKRIEGAQYSRISPIEMKEKCWGRNWRWIGFRCSDRQHEETEIVCMYKTNRLWLLVLHVEQQNGTFSEGGKVLKNLTQLIQGYTKLLQDGEIQAAYKGIMEFIGKLRADLIKRYPHDTVSSIYQGYLDMTYFSLTTEPLKNKGLKIAIVYLHEKGAFEVWLSARNREIAEEYESLVSGDISDELMVFHDDANHDAIIEYTLTPAPDFEDPDALKVLINKGVKKFVTAVSSRL